MKFKEVFNPNRVHSSVGTGKFRTNLMKEVILTPHERMDRVLQMIESRPTIDSSLRKYINFVMSKVRFTSEDQATADYLNEWLSQRETHEHSIKNEMKNFAKLLAACGNSYIEPTYVRASNGEVIIDNIFTMPDPSVVYYNFSLQFNQNNDGEEVDDDEFWLQEVPVDVRSFRGIRPTYKNIYYLRGSALARERKYVVPIHKNKLIHKKIGWSRDGYYGMGFLSSAIDDDDVFREILKNWALMSKYQALGKKIISFSNENGDPVDQRELDDIEHKFNELTEEESLFVNKNFKSESLSFVGETDNMQSQMDFLQREVGSSVLPSYLSPFSQDNALATATEAKNPFFLELSEFQDVLIKFFNMLIIDSLRKVNPKLAEDATIDFGSPDIYSREEKFAIYSQLYNMGASTMNELRDAVDLSTISNGDIFIQDSPLYHSQQEKEVDGPDDPGFGESKKENKKNNTGGKK